MKKPEEPQSIGEIVREVCEPEQLAASSVVFSAVSAGAITLGTEYARQGLENGIVPVAFCGGLALGAFGLSVTLWDQYRISRQK
jgi:hypothetical protein